MPTFNPLADIKTSDETQKSRIHRPISKSRGCWRNRGRTDPRSTSSLFSGDTNSCRNREDTAFYHCAISGPRLVEIDFGPSKLFSRSPGAGYPKSRLYRPLMNVYTIVYITGLMPLDRVWISKSTADRLKGMWVGRPDTDIESTARRNLLPPEVASRAPCTNMPDTPLFSETIGTRFPKRSHLSGPQVPLHTYWGRKGPQLHRNRPPGPQ